MNKKESVIFEFEMDFKKSFCCSFNLSNDDVISVLCKHHVAFCDHLQVWKRVRILQARRSFLKSPDN